MQKFELNQVGLVQCWINSAQGPIYRPANELGPVAYMQMHRDFNLVLHALQRHASITLSGQPIELKQSALLQNKYVSMLGMNLASTALTGAIGFTQNGIQVLPTEFNALEFCKHEPIRPMYQTEALEMLLKQEHLGSILAEGGPLYIRNPLTTLKSKLGGAIYWQLAPMQTSPINDEITPDIFLRAIAQEVGFIASSVLKNSPILIPQDGLAKAILDALAFTGNKKNIPVLTGMF